MTENVSAVDGKIDLFMDPADRIKDLLRLQTKLRVLLHMPTDLCELYQEPLTRRLKDSKIHLKILPPDKLPEDRGSYDWVLAYQCASPVATDGGAPDKSSESEPPAAPQALFDVNGAPSEFLMTPFPREAGYLTQLEHRYLQLKSLTRNQEDDEHFITLARIQRQIHSKLLEAGQMKTEAGLLSEQIKTVDDGYYHVLGYYLQEAVDNVMQVVTLGDVMKRYVKIMVIDDLGERCYEQLEDRGFRRRFVSIMSQHAFNGAYSQFKELYQQQHPGIVATYGDFYSKCSIFDENEIICINPWKHEDGKLPVQFLLRKPPDLSSKEVHAQKEDPARKAFKIDRLLNKRQKFQVQLDTTLAELQAAENRGNLSEADYVSLNKKRKRFIGQIKMLNADLAELQKVVSNKPQLSFYSRDFLRAVQDKKTARQIKAKEEAGRSEPVELNLAHMQNLAGLIRQKQKKDRSLRNLNAQIKEMAKKMQAYADLHPLDPEKSFQQVLGIHTLNKLEMITLGCGISKVNRLVNIYRGPYFEERWQKPQVNWEDPLISQVAVFIASKNIKVDTWLLQKFFRVDAGQMNSRLENSPVLPKTADFENDRYGLFILNNDSYSLEDITDCLRMRNLSKRAYVPVLILDPRDDIAVNGHKMMVDLLIGLKKESKKTISLVAPACCVDSLTAAETLVPVLCEVMGIDHRFVPAFSEDDEINFDIEMADSAEADENFDAGPSEIDFEDPAGTLKVSGESQASPVEKEKKADPKLKAISSRAGEPVNETITVFVEDEAPTEVYTLGSLFSFDDDTESAKVPAPPEEDEKLDDSAEPDPEKQQAELEYQKAKQEKEKANFENTNLF